MKTIEEKAKEYGGSLTITRETHFYGVILPKGSIFKLIGGELTWKDQPVKI